jgi:peptide chain release factor subunit 1
MGNRKSVTSGAEEVRRLISHRGRHPVISLYLDLDPERFATPPARASQIRSLVDSAAKHIESQQGLDHEQRIGLREDLRRIDSFLTSPEASFKGARSFAVFSSSGDELFETVKLSRPVQSQVVIEPTPYVAPMITAVERRRWLVALVNRRSARVLAGSADGLHERARLDDNVHGQHDKGGWSQANYERSIEADVEAHLKHIAEVVNHRWREERFDRVAIGGPQETVPRFDELLADEVRRQLAPGRVEVDISSATEAQIREAVEKLVAEDEKRTERERLDRLEEALGAGGRAVGGPRDTVEALNERRVSTLLIEPGFDGHGRRCPRCGLLLVDGDDRCPADGSELQDVDHLREAVVEAALAQDAGVLVVRSYPDLGPHRGVAALLRF